MSSYNTHQFHHCNPLVFLSSINNSNVLLFPAKSLDLYLNREKTNTLYPFFVCHFSSKQYKIEHKKQI